MLIFLTRFVTSEKDKQLVLMNLPSFSYGG